MCVCVCVGEFGGWLVSVFSQYLLMGTPGLGNGYNYIRWLMLIMIIRILLYGSITWHAQILYPARVIEV